MDAWPRITLSPCPKGYVTDLDKVLDPATTLARVRAKLAACSLDILAKTERVDIGRLGIPVFMSRLGRDARAIMPTRKQMGKGSSKEQAEASAVMELIERFSFFSFWQQKPYVEHLTFAEATERFGTSCIDPMVLTASVGEDLPPSAAHSVLNTVSWDFYPATDLTHDRCVWIPLDWFKLINEFNGTSAGNTDEESILQGLCEVVERHVCAEIDQHHTAQASIPLDSVQDPTLKRMIAAFKREHITLVLKDFSLGMPLPTIGAIAWDPQTYPDQSEIVYTAGTATSAEKAALRAVTEIAQLAGDFCTHACYEASGLPKYTELAEISWLLAGEQRPITDIPGVLADDITTELRRAIQGLAPRPVFAVRTSHPTLEIPAHYVIVPGLSFRERDKNQSLGLFVGRKLVEEGDLKQAEEGLATIGRIYNDAHFLPFFQGLLALRKNDLPSAENYFAAATPIQPTREARALCAFYQGYSASQRNDWTSALPLLQTAHDTDPHMQEYANLLGVALYKLGNYPAAKEVFLKVLAVNKGSAIDVANLGLCEEALGNCADAAEYFATALELDPSLHFAKEHLKTCSAHNA